MYYDLLEKFCYPLSHLLFMHRLSLYVYLSVILTGKGYKSEKYGTPRVTTLIFNITEYYTETL
jgi:hypothetical protein